MIKNILLFIVFLILGTTAVVIGYLWAVPGDTQLLKPFFPKTLFSIQNAPSESLKGEIASVSGSVAWQSRIAPYASLINSPQKLQQGEEVDTHSNGQAGIIFPGVGIINISSDSQINFIQTLPANFVVNEKQGTAVFEKTGTVPISIRGLDLLINLDSGKSSISVDKKTSQVTIRVEEGSVTLAFTDTNNNTEIVPISAGNEYVFNNNTKLGEIKAL